MKVIPFWLLICSSLVLFTGGCKPAEKSPQSSGPKPARPSQFLSLDVSDSTLTDFMEEDLPLLKRHLATSAHWKLTREGETLVAVRREPMDESTPDAGKLRMTADGFYFKHQPWRRYRARLSIGGPPTPPDAAWESIRTRAIAGGRDAQLEVQPVEHPDHRSYLLLSGENQLYLEILEESMDQGRESTRRLLREINQELEQVLDRDEEDAEAPILPGLTPKESTSRDAAAVRLERVPRASGFHLFGYVNPGAEGVTYARLFDKSGTEIAPEAVQPQTSEHLGWSSDRGLRFFFNSRVQLPEGSSAPARVELWFRPGVGGEPRKLLEAKVAASG